MINKSTDIKIIVIRIFLMIISIMLASSTLNITSDVTCTVIFLFLININIIIQKNPQFNNIY